MSTANAQSTESEDNSGQNNADASSFPYSSSAWIKLKPRACALDRNLICSVDILVEYQADVPVCLTVQQMQLTCTESNSLQQYQYTYTGRESLSFALLTSQAVTLAQAELQVLQLAHYRRRQRNPWSLF